VDINKLREQLESLSNSPIIKAIKDFENSVNKISNITKISTLEQEAIKLQKSMDNDYFKSIFKSQEEYKKLYTIFNLARKEQIINKNFYYDDTNESFKKANSALRIRYTNNKTEMTLKIKGASQNIEINVPLDESFPKEPTVLPTLPNEIMSELERLDLKIKTPMLIQKIETQRYEVKTQDGLLVLDKTTFLKDIVDYELEFEATSFEKGKIAFENLLTEFDITNKPAKPKIARAMEYAEG